MGISGVKGDKLEAGRSQESDRRCQRSERPEMAAAGAPEYFRLCLDFSPTCPSLIQ